MPRRAHLASPQARPVGSQSLLKNGKSGSYYYYYRKSDYMSRNERQRHLKMVHRRKLITIICSKIICPLYSLSAGELVVVAVLNTYKAGELQCYHPML